MPDDTTRSDVATRALTIATETQATVSAHIKQCDEREKNRDQRWAEIRRFHESTMVQMSAQGDSLREGLVRVHQRLDDTNKDRNKRWLSAGGTLIVLLIGAVGFLVDKAQIFGG